MKVLQICGLLDQEIDSGFTNHESLIPTLVYFEKSFLTRNLVSPLGK